MHLERLQRQRKGEFVPAPISIDVNVTGLNRDDWTSRPDSRDVTLEAIESVELVNGGDTGS